MKYVLITAARNEEAFIEKTLASMAAQTLLPERWVIVDDGSTSFDFDVIGNLDANISFERDYFEFLLGKFAEFPRLGVAGTAMREAIYDA